MNGADDKGWIGSVQRFNLDDFSSAMVEREVILLDKVKKIVSQLISEAAMTAE